MVIQKSICVFILLFQFFTVRSQVIVESYDLFFEVNVSEKSISGYNKATFEVGQEMKTIHFALLSEMRADSAIFNNKQIPIKRLKDSLELSFPEELIKNKRYALTIYFHGKPREAKLPPWSGGFVWTKDSLNRDWVNLACQGEGAQLWWPVHPDLSNEPKKASMTFLYPAHLTLVSNGRKTKEEKFSPDKKLVKWEVSYPINTYNITFYLGNYVLISDTLNRQEKTLELSYYVLDYNKEKAEKWFGKEVKPMLRCYENAFGLFPFERDGFKLVQSTYAGMEHQSAIAYGNGFSSGYLGDDYSGLGLDFDFILVHETGHEWWGNSISKKTKADFWIHEAFCTYAEKVYVKCRYGEETAEKYIYKKRALVKNESPIAGKESHLLETLDLYTKGSLIINNMEHIISRKNNWEVFLRRFAEENKHKNIETEDIIRQFSLAAGMPLKAVFEQFLYHKDLPELEYIIEKDDRGFLLRYRWNADIQGFDMPIKAKIDQDYEEWFYPQTTWKEYRLTKSGAPFFQWREDLFYVKFKVSAQ
jgi:aminopeptidase N